MVGEGNNNLMRRVNVPVVALCVFSVAVLLAGCGGQAPVREEKIAVEIAPTIEPSKVLTATETARPIETPAPTETRRPTETRWPTRTPEPQLLIAGSHAMVRKYPFTDLKPNGAISPGIVVDVLGVTANGMVPDPERRSI